MAADSLPPQTEGEIEMQIQEIRELIANERVIVKVGRDWWLARERKVFDFGNGQWMISINAGPKVGRGFISNIDDNTYGREYRII